MLAHADVEQVFTEGAKLQKRKKKNVLHLGFEVNACGRAEGELETP